MTLKHFQNKVKKKIRKILNAVPALCLKRVMERVGGAGVAEAPAAPLVVGPVKTRPHGLARLAALVPGQALVHEGHRAHCVRVVTVVVEVLQGQLVVPGGEPPPDRTLINKNQFLK